MLVCVEREVDNGVPQSLLNYHAMDSLLEHEAVGGVTQVVGPNIGQPGRGKNPRRVDKTVATIPRGTV